MQAFTISVQLKLKSFSSYLSTAFMLRHESEFLDEIPNLKQNLLKNWKEQKFSSWTCKVYFKAFSWSSGEDTIYGEQT